ncbi:unnamed protein product [Prorocentrum cordatum]|uniref:Dynein light chain n=1 Tax=Prorocentrum cordatum TaxID=2364126 RepID=A0ABN9UIF6_9DINO|nr:unnamed protein product [Polarella glacialis]
MLKAAWQRLWFLPRSATFASVVGAAAPAMEDEGDNEFVSEQVNETVKSAITKTLGSNVQYSEQRVNVWCTAIMDECLKEQRTVLPLCGHVHHNAEERLPAAHGPRAALGHEDGRRLLRPGGPRHDGRHRHGLRVHDLKPAPGCRPPRWSRCHLPRPALAVCSLPQRPRRGAGGDPRREVSGSGPREAEKAPSPCLAVCSLPPLLRHCRRTLLPCSTSPCASLRTPRRWRRGLSASARPAGQEASPARGGGLSVARCLGDER